MKRLSMIVAALTLVCASANAQSMLERLGQRAKDAVENKIGEKVEDAVNNGVNKVFGGKQQASQPQAQVRKQVPNSNRKASDEFIYTARGAFDKADDPYKLYVDALSNDPNTNYYDAYKELTDMGGDKTSFAFKSISEVVAAYPGIPTARQMAVYSERKSSAEALRNYDKGVSNYLNIDMVEQANNLRVAASNVSPGSSDNGMAMQKAVFEGAKKLGKTADQLTESEIMSILEGMDATPFAAASTATNGEAFDSVTDRISAILDRAMSTNVTIQKVERSLSQFEPIEWKGSEAWQQVYDNEAEIDPRIVSYWDQTHKEDYPEFWKEARRAQNAIIDKFNIQQAVKWRKVLQAELEPQIALLQEIAAADAELESLATDKSLLDYSIARNQINSAYMMVSLVVNTITQYAYAVPLVSNTVEDGYGQ